MFFVPFEEIKYVDNEIGVDDVSVTYSQNSDNSGLDGEEEVQTITISTRNNGVARYINFKSDSWSISNINEFRALFEDFIKRAFLK